MAIRRITAADIPTLRARWDTYKAAGVDFPGVPSLDAVRMLKVINDQSNIVLIDPATKTLAICITPGNLCEIELIFTMTTGVLASIHAVDAMLKVVVQGAIARNMPSVWAAQSFPASVDAEAARIVRYLSTLTPPGVKTTIAPDGTQTVFNPDGTIAVTPGAPRADGSTYVRGDWTDLPALLAALTARTP